MNNEGLIRSRAKRSLLGYLVVWTACVVWFFFLDGSDAMGYSLAVFFLILPLSALVSGYFCGKTVDRRKWLLVPALGLMHSLAHYVTFSLANMMAFHKINAPTLSGTWMSMLPACIGLLAGTAAAHLHRRKSE